MRKRSSVFVEVKSYFSEKSLSDLVKEAYSSKVCFFDVKIGEYSKQWRGVTRETPIIYVLDDVTVCGGDIIFIRQKVFRPKWIPDDHLYRLFVDFSYDMCVKSFGDENWKETMYQKHSNAIDQNRWLFATFAIMNTNNLYLRNKEVLLKRIQSIELAKREMTDTSICSLSD